MPALRELKAAIFKMSKVRWCASIALAITLSSSLAHRSFPQEEGNRQGQVFIPLPPFSLSDAFAQPDRATEPCGKGEEKRFSDLCAQWKAADAAQEGADWTRRAFWLGFAGLVVASLTLLAASAAAWFAKRAAEQAKLGVDAARDGVDETRRIGEAQTRAYLSCTGASYKLSGHLCAVTLRVKNFGQSPAKHALVSAALITPDFEAVGVQGMPTLRTQDEQKSLYDIPASGEEKAIVVLKASFPKGVARDLVEDAKLFLVEGTLTWNDVFGKPQHITFTLSPDDGKVTKVAGGLLVRTGEMFANNTRGAPSGSSSGS
jgi:hypothetical protein